MNTTDALFFFVHRYIHSPSGQRFVLALASGERMSATVRRRNSRYHVTLSELSRGLWQVVPGEPDAAWAAGYIQYIADEFHYCSIPMREAEEMKIAMSLPAFNPGRHFTIGDVRAMLPEGWVVVAHKGGFAVYDHVSNLVAESIRVHDFSGFRPFVMDAFPREPLSSAIRSVVGGEE
jgi:hypothetical protein